MLDNLIPATSSAEMLNVPLVAPVRPVAAVAGVATFSDLSIDLAGSDYTLTAAATVLVPNSGPPPGFVPIARVIQSVAVVTVLPPASWTVTVTAGVIATPATVFVGCAVNASLLANPTVMLNVPLVAPVRPVAAAVSV